MYELHPSFNLKVDQSAKIWRYMDFTKFVKMLKSDSLYFNRANLLGDPFEAAYTRPMEKEYAAAMAISRELISGNLATTDELGNYMRSHAMSFHDTYAKFAIKSFYVNCWHINANESAAMWKLYMKSGEGVAIQSTVGQLIKAANRSTDTVYIGEIKYLDYNNESFDRGNSFNAIVCKRQSFAHERELRAVIYKPLTLDYVKGGEPVKREDGSSVGSIPDFSDAYRDHPVGIDTCNNIKKIINKVYINPESCPWFGDLVAEIAQDYHLPCTVERSSLGERPVW